MPAAIAGNKSVVVNFSSQAAEGKSVSGVQFQYSTDGKNYTTVANLDGNATSYTWVAPKVDATNTVKIRIIATDSRGLTTEQESNTFSILSTPPTLALTTPNEIANRLNSVTFAGTCKPGIPIQYSPGYGIHDSADVTAAYNRISPPSCTPQGNQGTWSLTINETNLNQVFSYNLSQTDAAGNKTSIAFTWTRSTKSPVITPNSFILNGGSAFTSNHNVLLSIRATDDLLPVQYACFKWSVNNAIPSAPSPFTVNSNNDPCWNTISAWSGGNVTASPSVSFQTNYSIGFLMGTYSVYAWVQDSVGNISTLSTPPASSSATGILGTDLSKIYYTPAQPPSIDNIVVANTDTPSTHIQSTEMTFSKIGAPVYIKWNIQEGNGGNLGNNISLYYTTDEKNYTLITSGLSNGANGQCSVLYNKTTDTLPSETGCYLWSSGAPTTSYFKIRVAATNTKDMTAYAASAALNTNQLHWLAGNTDLGLGGSAAAAIFVNRDNGHDPGDHHTLAITSDGTVFFRDNLRGVLRIDPVSGVVENYLPITGKYSGDGSAATRPSNSVAQPTWSGVTLRSADMITLDYNDNLLVYDSNRIIQVDHQTGVATTIIGGSGKNSTADSISAAADLYLPQPATSDGHLFQPLPNGDLVFQADSSGGFSFTDNTVVKIRYYHAAEKSITTLHLTGTGAELNSSRDPKTDPACSPHHGNVDYIHNFAILFDPNSSALTAINGLLYGNNTQISNICPAGMSFDPNSGISLSMLPSPVPHMIWPRANGTTPDVYTDASRFNARNGDLYSVSRMDSALLKYDPKNNVWNRILGNGTRGHCQDGTLATQCPVQIMDAFVTLSNEVFFTDNGEIRVLYNDANNNVLVKTLFGQSRAFGDGGLAISARFNSIPWLDMTASGKITISDDHENVIRQFPTSQTVSPIIQTIAGTGVVAPITAGTLASSSALSLSAYSGPESMVSIPGTEDLLVGQTGWGVFRYHALDGKWYSFLGKSSGNGWLSADGMKTSGIKGGTRRMDVLGATSDPSTSTDTMLIAGYSSDLNGNNSDAVAKTYASTDGFMTATQGGLAGVAGVAGTVFSPDGTPVSSSTIPQSETLLRSTWDPVQNAWFMASNVNPKRITVLKEGGGATVLSYTLPRVVRSFTYVSAADSTANAPHGSIYYCGQNASGWQLYQYDTVSKIESAPFAWPSTTIQCAGNALVWDAANNGLIFTLNQNELAGVAEYIMSL